MNFLMSKKMTPNQFAVILPAGGIGKRMGQNIPKQLLTLGNKPVYRYSLETFLMMDEISEVVLVVPADWKSHFENEKSNLPNSVLSKLKIVIGAEERYLSVKKGLEALESDAEYVLVHDVARPFISKEIIYNVFEMLKTKGSCLVARPATDTIKIVQNEKVERTLDRNTVWLAQTPQATQISLLKTLYQKLEQTPPDFIPTDEASILEFFGEPVFIVPGNSQNDKLTTPEDFKRFASFISNREQT